METTRRILCKSRRTGSILLSLLLAAVTLASNAASRIELVDGTVINGDLLSMSNGRYVVQSTTLGRIELPQSSIRAIEPVIGKSSGSGGGNVDFQAIQQQITTSPELMQLVTALMSDPQIQTAMKDPEFMRLILSGDVAALKDDPRMLKLMGNPSIQAIIGKMQPR